MKDTFIIKQDLSFKEYFSIYVFILARRKIFRFIVVIPFVLFLINMFLHYCSLLEGESLYSWIIPSLVSLLFPFAFFGIVGFLVMGSIYVGKKKYFKNVVYEFNHWGMVKKGSGVEITVQWNRLAKIKETKKFFLLFMGTNISHIIQKRMMNENEIEDFKSFVKDRLPTDFMT